MKTNPVRLWFLLCMLVMAGCATTPKDATQTIYSVGWSLVGATNSVADLKDAALRPNLLHQFAAIMFFNLCMDMGHDIRRADIDSVGRAQSELRLT
jgi:hypothetical protein